MIPETDGSESRMMRGEKIAKEKAIAENADGSFSVPSQTIEEIAYLVRLIDNKYVCNCLDFKYKEMRAIEACKHIHAVKFWIASQVEINQKPKPKVFADDSVQCPKCASIRIVKFGHDSGKQVFKCKDCSHKFRELSLLKKAQYTPETVSLTLDLYFSGMSLRKIVRTLSDSLGIDLSYGTVYAWIKRYIPKISEYVNSLAPTLSDTWHVDELFVKVKGGLTTKTAKNIAYLWNVMDRKTRFLLASKLSHFRDNIGCNAGLNEAIRNSHNSIPEKIYTDSARAYWGCTENAFPDPKTRPIHIPKAGINKPHNNNNRIERLNGTLRERVKVQRGWKTFETLLAEGERIHYNFVKPHMELEGMTPAQNAGIGIAGKNKWLELLKSSNL